MKSYAQGQFLPICYTNKMWVGDGLFIISFFEKICQTLLLFRKRDYLIFEIENYFFFMLHARAVS